MILNYKLHSGLFSLLRGDLGGLREMNFQQNLKDGFFLPAPTDKEDIGEQSRVKPDSSGEWHCLPNLMLLQYHESVPGLIKKPS